MLLQMYYNIVESFPDFPRSVLNSLVNILNPFIAELGYTGCINFSSKFGDVNNFSLSKLNLCKRLVAFSDVQSF
jgi:hypothetical protein